MPDGAGRVGCDRLVFGYQRRSQCRSWWPHPGIRSVVARRLYRFAGAAFTFGVGDATDVGGELGAGDEVGGHGRWEGWAAVVTPRGVSDRAWIGRVVVAIPSRVGARDARPATCQPVLCRASRASQPQPRRTAYVCAARLAVADRSADLWWGSVASIVVACASCASSSVCAGPPTQGLPW